MKACVCALWDVFEATVTSSTVFIYVRARVGMIHILGASEIGQRLEARSLRTLPCEGRLSAGHTGQHLESLSGKEMSHILQTQKKSNPQETSGLPGSDLGQMSYSQCYG